MNTLARANRVAVQTLEDGSFEARFFRTHKHISTINSKDTAFTPNPDSNKTAQREQFREWVCTNGNLFGVSYDPDDKRIDDYKLPAKYTDDNVLSTASIQLITPDINKWVSEVQGLGLISIDVDQITEVTKSGKGTKVDSKYLNGNWAWASINIITTVKAQDTEGYVSMTVDLVSGQLKKPSAIGNGSYSMTGFKTEVLRDLGNLLIPKSEKSPSMESESSDLVTSSDQQIDKSPDIKVGQQSDSKEGEPGKLDEAKKKADRKSRKSKIQDAE